MFSSDEDVNDCQKFYIYFVYRDFLYSSGPFSLTLGFSELAEDRECHAVWFAVQADTQVDFLEPNVGNWSFNVEKKPLN